MKLPPAGADLGLREQESEFIELWGMLGKNYLALSASGDTDTFGHRNSTPERVPAKLLGYKGVSAVMALG